MDSVLSNQRVSSYAELTLSPQFKRQWHSGYQSIKAPRSLRHRYIFEDVPFSLVPIAALGKRFGVNVWAIDSLIQLACVAHSTDFYHRGRTVESMGLAGLRVSEIRNLVKYGHTEPPDLLAADRHNLQEPVS